MAFEKKFELKLYVPANWEVTGSMADNWEKRLLDSAVDIKDKLDAKLPDDGTFERDLVNPSSNAYGPMLNPSFVSKSDRTTDNIRATRQGNMVQSFSRWKENLTKAFATVDGVVAKVFKDKVSAAKDRWAIKMGKGALRFTGDKIRGRSVAPITAYYIVGDLRATSWIAAGDVADGDPYNIAKDGQRPALKAAILGRIVQGGIMITNAGSDATAEILRQSTINAELLTGLCDTAKCDDFVAVPAVDKCYCAWETDPEGRLILHTLVGLTTL
ncbi:MAG: hypothetical protein V1871_08300 [Planctomycetota bacterium]